MSTTGGATTAPTSPAPARRGPKGARVGDIVLAERSRWRVQELDPERRQAVCLLLAGSRVLRRVRARQIEDVERAPRRRSARHDA
jgi:hypothetical protein